MDEMKGQEQPQEPQPAPAAILTPDQERTWAMLCHLLGLATLIAPFVGNVVGPLVVWLIQRDKSALVDQNGKESLNFQISVSIYGIAASILMAVGIGCFIMPVVLVFGIVMAIMGAVKASKGEPWRYPLCIRFIS